MINKKFKQITLSILSLAVALALLAPALSAAATDYDPSKIVYPPASKLNIPTPEKYELPNGMKLLLIEDHRLPLIEMSVLIKVSSYYDPADKAGLASLTGTVMRTGGTIKMSGDEIDLKLEKVAAMVETYIGDDSGGAYLNCLKENLDTSLVILADILRTPRFDPEKIDLAKVEMKSEISRRNDDVGGITSREFQRLLWGKDSAKGMMAEYDTVNAITREDLINFHKHYFAPNNMIIGVVGDFKTKDMKSKLQKAFGDWKKIDIAFPSVEIRKEAPKSVSYIFKEDIEQSNVRMGYIVPDLQYKNPDYPAVSLMNYILGESFTSRIFKEVRTKKGLAYSAYGRFVFSFDEPGYYLAFCQTKFASTCLATDTIIEVMNGMKTGNITQDEFTLGKNALLNSFVFGFDKNRKILEKQLDLEFYGYPADFYTKYRDALENLKIEDIEAVAKKYLDTSNLTLLVVGKKDQFDAPLDKYGAVAEIDITIPEPKAEPMPDATAETIAAGKELMKKVINAYGGTELLLKNKSRTEEYTLTITMPQGEFSMEGKTYSIYPDKYRMDMNSVMGSMVRVYSGDTGWAEMGGKVMDLSEAEVRDAKKERNRELTWLAENLEKITLYTAGDEDIDQRKTTRLIIKNGDEHIATFSVDKESFLILKRSYMGKDAMSGAPIGQEAYSSDFKIISGIQVPFKIVIKQVGKQIMEIKMKKVEIGTPISEELFQKKSK
jgi:predicted Zn-dependent peptidase